MRRDLLKTTAIILSAGKGRRLASDIPKQYMDVCGRPLLAYCLEAFEASCADKIIIVCGAGDEEFVRENIAAGFGKVSRIVSGGAERYDSVLCGLRAAAGTDIALIHDGARPFISHDAINKAVSAALEYGAAVCGMPVKDTIKLATGDGFIESSTKRSLTWLMQTPQAFKYDLILKAYESVLPGLSPGDRSEITDDAGVFKLAYPDSGVKLIEGGYENIKITTAEDLEFAAWKLGQGLISD